MYGNLWNSQKIKDMSEKPCNIWGFHSGIYEELSILGYDDA
jgi:hypothetical protein